MPRFSDDFLDEIKSRVPISQVVTGYVTFERKKSVPAKGDYWFCCPVHGEKSPSAHCEDKKGRWHCFGCNAGGNHFRFLQDVAGMTFPRAVETVASLAGIPVPGATPMTDEEKREWARRKGERERAEQRRQQEEDRDRDRRINSVKGIWQDTLPFAGSLAQTYLNWRAPGLGDFEDESIRFHPGLPHPTVPGNHPCLVAKVSGIDGAGVGIWRIYLAKDGHGKMQGGDAKLGLGPAAGGAVRLGGIGKTIGICEGIETGRAIRMMGVPYPVWPALSTSGIIGFKIPAGVERVICYPDPDGDKLKTRERHDGTRYIAQPPGKEAVRKFIESNPDVDIRMADAAQRDDYLEVLQRMKGVPQR